LRCGATERAASRLEAAVTAEMMTSAPFAGSAADEARCTPIFSPFVFSFTPAA
jgi:hypothetical protein